MTSTFSTCVRAVLVATVACTSCRLAFAGEVDTPVMPRVRAESAAMAALIQKGLDRSATFRNLVAAIDRTDGIVYIGEGACGHGVRACLVLTVQVAGPHRVLRIRINPRDATQELVSSIGHELQHALEVLKVPSIRSDAAIYQFFDRVGPTGSERFETPEAVRAGLAVLTELGRER